MKTKIDILQDIQNKTLLLKEIEQTIEALETIESEGKRASDENFIDTLRCEWHSIRMNITSLQAEYIKSKGGITEIK